jgi:hypothetical protein
VPAALAAFVSGRRAGDVTKAVRPPDLHPAVVRGKIHVHLEQAFLRVWFPDASATWSHYQGAQTRSDAATATTGEGETMDIGKIVREIVIEPIEQPVREPAQPARPPEPEPAPEREPVAP